MSSNVSIIPPFVVSDSEGETIEVEDGKLLVNASGGSIPPGTTGFSSVSSDEIPGNDQLDVVESIADGVELTLTSLSIGAERGNSRGSSVALYEDADGTGATLTLIAHLFANGSSDQMYFNFSIVGDGSAAIRIRRRRHGGGDRIISYRLEGYTI